MIQKSLYIQELAHELLYHECKPRKHGNN